MLSILLVILAFNYLDRLVLGLLSQNIKAEFQISDTQLGLLGGIGFAFFYSIMGIPIARLADRGNRVTIIAVTTAIWSVAVAACGFVGSFLQLLIVRIGVAVGEAGGIPPAQALIADTFTRSERPKAVSIYLLGSPLSSIVGCFAAGWLNSLYGWRSAFIVLGSPGVLLAVFAWLGLKEPRKPASRSGQIAPTSYNVEGTRNASFQAVSAALWRIPTFRHLLFCVSVWFFFGYGIIQWQPAFFIRSFGINTGELGTWYAAIWGGGGLLGTYLGGILAVRFAPKNEALQLKWSAISFLLYGLLSTLIYLTKTPYVAFALMAVAAVGFSASTGPIFATIQTIVPDEMRATAFALIYLFANLIGMGLGPVAVGALSDSFQMVWKNESLRYALLVASPGYLWCSWHLWMASRTINRAAPLHRPIEPTN